MAIARLISPITAEGFFFRNFDDAQQRQGIGVFGFCERFSRYSDCRFRQDGFLMK